MRLNHCLPATSPTRLIGYPDSRHCYCHAGCDHVRHRPVTSAYPGRATTLLTGRHAVHHRIHRCAAAACGYSALRGPAQGGSVRVREVRYHCANRPGHAPASEFLRLPERWVRESNSSIRLQAAGMHYRNFTFGIQFAQRH